MLKIKDIELKNKVICAPMASVTNRAYRQLLMKYEPGLYFNEMVSDQAVNYRNSKTLEMLESLPNEHPIAFQLFGSDIKHMVKAAKYLDQETDCDIIDINMGCPVSKVVKTGAGSALMKDISYASELAYQVKQVIQKPLTVKIRSGWDTQNINASELSVLLEKAGVDAISVHGRTRSQMYEGQADLDIIKRVKESVSIPVIGNGDVTNAKQFLTMLNHTKCDGVMIGRGLLGSPWIIEECKRAFNHQGTYEITVNERLALLLEHAHYLVELMGEERAIKQMRSHAAWGFKGLRNSHHIKSQLVQMKTMHEFVKILEEYKGNCL